MAHGIEDGPTAADVRAVGMLAGWRRVRGLRSDAGELETRRGA
jgi:hypothetical protein